MNYSEWTQTHKNFHRGCAWVGVTVGITVAVVMRVFFQIGFGIDVITLLLINAAISFAIPHAAWFYAVDGRSDGR